VVPASNAEVGCTSGPGSYVKQVAVVNGRIDITYGNGAHWAIQDKVLSLTPYEFDSGTGMLTWRCGNTPAPANAQPLAEYLPSTVESKYLPAQCRS
jgi:type IV pilus assembly protein PilA